MSMRRQQVSMRRQQVSMRRQQMSMRRQQMSWRRTLRHLPTQTSSPGPFSLKGEGEIAPSSYARSPPPCAK